MNKIWIQILLSQEGIVIEKLYRDMSQLALIVTSWQNKIPDFLNAVWAGYHKFIVQTTKKDEVRMIINFKLLYSEFMTTLRSTAKFYLKQTFYVEKCVYVLIYKNIFYRYMERGGDRGGYVAY